MANLTDVFGGDPGGDTGDGLTVYGGGGGIDNYPTGGEGDGPHGDDGFDDAGGSNMTVQGSEGGIDNYPLDGGSPGGFGADGLIGGDMGHAQIEDLPIN